MLSLERDWITTLSVVSLLLLLVGFFGALHPAFDGVSVARPALVALLAMLAVIQVFRGHAQRALYISMATVFGFGSIMAHANLEKLGQNPDLTMMQVNTTWENDLADEVIDRLSILEPDIVAMQSITDRNRDIATAIAVLYPYSAVCGAADEGAVAVYSRFAFAHNQLPYCDDGWGYVIAPLQTPIGVVNAGSVNIRQKFLSADTEQSARIEAYLRETEGPNLIAGDFSNAAWSYRVKQIAAAANSKPAPGVARTSHNLFGMLGFRMNHVLVPESWVAETMVVKVPGSSSDAVYADIYFN